jgi:hypothetical protein
MMVHLHVSLISHWLVHLVTSINCSLEGANLVRNRPLISNVKTDLKAARYTSLSLVALAYSGTTVPVLIYRSAVSTLYL